MKRTASFALALLGFASVTIIAGCGGGSSSRAMTGSPITVSVSVGANAVEATGQDGLTATVNNDPSGKGVTWTVSCSAAQCGTISASPSASGSATTFTATYTAPATSPPSDLTVTVKATSVSDSSKFGSNTIIVSAITISINISGQGATASTATTATVQVGKGNVVQMNASVNNDPSNQGVTFTLSPTSQAGNLTVQDPFDATYNAPATPPASDLTVTVTATSVTDSTKKTTVTITVPSVTISVTPLTATVDATGTVNIVATVGNDPSGKGVTWTVSCSGTSCGSIPAGPTLSARPTTYTAPPTPPDPGDLTVTVTATSVADPPAQGPMTITVKAISVTVTISGSTTVLFGQTSGNIGAVVNDDPAKNGVTWAIQPCGVTDCGSISANKTPSGQPITYTAPANPLANDLSVTIVATSDSDTAQTGSINMTVPAITVAVGICTDVSCSVSRPSAIIPVNATTNLNSTPIKATVNNDSSSQVNVNWTLTQNGTACSAATCGTVTPTTTASGTPTIYAAPATANPSVTITATSATDTSKSATATITLTGGTVKLIPAALNFGNLKISRSHPHPTATLSETLTNTGASVLNITGETIAGTNAGAFSVNTAQSTCSASARSGASCVIAVTFAPPSAGTFNATLSIADSDITSPQQIPLSGQAHSCFFRCPPAAELRSALARNQITSVPFPTGASRVGTRLVDVLDATRSDPYQNVGKRELLVRFWYPAAVGKNCQTAEYTSPSVWNYLAQLERVSPFKVKTNSCQDSPMAAGKHPVVVFTHGYTGTFTDYTFLFEDLASRGYVVASVNHTYEATAVQFPDGRIVKSLVGTHLGPSLQLDAEATSFAVAARLADLKSVLDELERINASPTNPFTNRLDLSRVALAGHSLGGLTALLGLEMDPRFKAAVSIDGITPGGLFGTTHKPVMMLFAGRDAWDQDTCRLWGQLQGPRFAMSLKGSEHLTPSDAVWLAKGAVQTGTVGMEKTVASIRDYFATFLDVNLNGKPTDRLLTGASSDYPDVEVTTQTQTPCGEVQNDLRK
jgi:dienelactone hydrolase